MNSVHCVKHPSIPKENFVGDPSPRRLAWCAGGIPSERRLRVVYVVDSPQNGLYLLFCSWNQVLDGKPDSQAEGLLLLREESLDQATVDKILAVEGQCQLSLMGYDF